MCLNAVGLKKQPLPDLLPGLLDRIHEASNQYKAFVSSNWDPLPPALPAINTSPFMSGGITFLFLRESNDQQPPILRSSWILTIALGQHHRPYLFLSSFSKASEFSCLSRPACCRAFFALTTAYVMASSYLRAFFLSTKLQRDAHSASQMVAATLPSLHPVRSTLLVVLFPHGQSG